MADGGEAREAYAAWAEAQDQLIPYARPAWLDIVAPEKWRAQVTLDGKGGVQSAWPYVPKRTMGLRWASLPTATAYLGPSFSTSYPGPAPPLPPDLGYAVFTVHDPRAAWLYGRRCRAMATQVIELTAAREYDADLRRLLRRGRESLRVRRAESDADFSAFAKALRANSQAGTPEWAVHFRRAQAEGLARVFLVEDGDGRAHGFAALPYDGQAAYLSCLLRSVNPHPSAAVSLLDHAIEEFAAIGASELDLQAGYLPGVRNFFARFGPQPKWYGLVRLPRNRLYGALDTLRAVTSTRRL